MANQPDFGGDADPDVGSLRAIYEENEGEGSEFVGEEGEDVPRRKKRKPPFRRKGLDYTLREDRQKFFMGVEKDMLTAKNFLKQQEESPQKIIVYDHLAAVIDKLVNERPPNAGDAFEEYCRILKKDKYYPASDHLQDMYIIPQFTESERILRMLKAVQLMPVTRDNLDNEDTHDLNLLESLDYFEQIGLGFSRLETFCLTIKIESLVKKERFKSYRFWGKILGIYNDYIILEAEQFSDDIQRFVEEEEMEERRKQEQENMVQDIITDVLIGGLTEKENEQTEKKGDAEKDKDEKKKEEEKKGKKEEETRGKQEAAEREEEFGEEEEPPPRPPPEFPPLPESTFEKPPEAPREKRGEGPNRKVYYVCTRLDDEWIPLPDVTPQQIQVARKIKKLMTGDLDAEVLTYPPFPGKEINYLRAQIARISASTQVSPKGYFKVEGAGGDEEMEEEEEELPEEEGEEGEGGVFKKGPVVPNPSYRPKSIKDLIQLKNWVHHQEALLKQGRCTFWDPDKEKMFGEGEEEEPEEEELEEEEEGQAKGGKEKALPLFRPLTKDTCADMEKLWTIQMSTSLRPEVAFVHLRSELWPGYFAFCSGSKYDSFYVGWGIKYSPQNYTVPAVPIIQREYLVGPEIMEMADPTWEQEEAWRIAHEPKVRKGMEYGGEGEEELEEESEEGGDSPSDID